MKIEKSLEAAAWEGVWRMFQTRHGPQDMPRLDDLKEANRSAMTWEEYLIAARAAITAYLNAIEEAEPRWKPMHEAPTDGQKIIIGQVAKFVPYKEPQKMGRPGRWQVRDEYGKWSNCDRHNDYWLDGYKVDAT